MFERTEDQEMYLEDESLIPIIIKYTERDAEKHNSHNDVPFDDNIKQLEGVHDFIVINRGINEKYSCEEFEITIEDLECSVKLRIDKDNNYFYSPRFTNKLVFTPEGDNEYIEIKANLIFTTDVGIGFWNNHGLVNRISDINVFMSQVQSLSVPFDDSQLGYQNKKAWEVYAEGMSRLNKEKQALLPIKSISAPHKKRSRFGELITVLDVELDLPDRRELFRQALTETFKKKVESKYLINFPTNDICHIEFNSFHQFGEGFEDQLNDLAEKHCFNLDGGIKYSIKGKVSLKQDNDFDEILTQLDLQLGEYADDFKRVGSNYTCDSDDTAEYLSQLINSTYSEFLALGPTKPIIGTFQNTDNDYDSIKTRLIETGLLEKNIRIHKGLIQVKSIGKPLNFSGFDFSDLKLEKCTIKYTLTDGAFDSAVQFEELDTVSIPNKGGYYEGIIFSLDDLKEKSLNWQLQVKQKFENKFKGQVFEYSFRKKLNSEPLKKLQRDVFFGNEKIQIAAMRGVVSLRPSTYNEYKDLLRSIKDNLPKGISVQIPNYSVEKEIKLIYEEEEACKRMFNKIRNGISSLDDIITLRFDGVDFTTRHFEFSFLTQEERNEKIEAIYSAFNSFKKVCNIHFDSLDGNTIISLVRNNKLENDYLNSFKVFNNETIKVVNRSKFEEATDSSALIKAQARIDSIQDDIDEIINEMPAYSKSSLSSVREKRRKLGSEKSYKIQKKKEAIERKRDIQKEINIRTREVLFAAPTIGECEARSYNRITIKLPNGFDYKSYSENPLLAVGEFLFFPMAGSASETGRQKFALDRIDGKKQVKDNPPVNKKLSSFLFNPRYAAPTSEDKIQLASNWIREYSISKSLNDKQVEAVAKACSAKDIAFIQGPPGTGKTTVIAEIIWKEIHQKQDCKILLTSQNNLAVDNALERLKNARGLRPVRILNTEDKEDGETIDGAQYMIDVIQSWRENPTKHNSDNAAAQWMKSVKNTALSNAEYDKYSSVIKSWVDCLDDNCKYARDMFAESYQSNVNLMAATCSYCASKDFAKTYNMLYDNGKVRFDVIIMDEASKATLPEMAVPMVNGAKIILIGDHRQLPPILDVEHKKAFEIMESKDLFEESYDTLKTSHFGVMFKAAQHYVPSIVSTLTYQYRMHEQIMNTINQFYKRDIEGGLKCGIIETMDLETYEHPGSRYHGLSFDRILTPDIHAIWVDVDTPEIDLNPGFKNPGEVDAIEMVIKMLNKAKNYDKYIASQKKEEDREIGIITFYSGQRKEIVNRKLPEGNKYRISAVDKFQGMERNIIIVSTVRSNNKRNIGFARESERINVAFSRAKKLLIVVGNNRLYSKFEDYNESISNMHTIDYKTLKDLLK